MFEKLKQFVKQSDISGWNKWKRGYSKQIIFRKKNFTYLETKVIAGLDLSFVRFYSCTFPKAMVFYNCSFKDCIFKECHFLERGNFEKSDFRSSKFKIVHFTRVNFIETIMKNCKFDMCEFQGVDFRHASLIECKFVASIIEDCEIYGTNIWDIDTDNKTVQKDLRIPFKNLTGKENISIDDLQLGNVIYLLLDNSNYKKWIDQSKSTSVLILGRFSRDLKTNISKLKNSIRDHNLSPIVMDFDCPTTLDLIEAIILLSFLSKFIIVDLTNPKSVPAELQAILSTLMIPVVPIIRHNRKPHSSFSFASKFKWVLPILEYEKIEDIQEAFEEAILQPATKMYNEIKALKNNQTTFLKAKDFQKRS